MKSAIEIEADIKRLKTGLDFGGYRLQDPFSLEEGWLEDEEGGRYQ